MPEGHNLKFLGPNATFVLRFLGPAPTMNHVIEGPVGLSATATSAPTQAMPLAGSIPSTVGHVYIKTTFC